MLVCTLPTSAGTIHWFRPDLAVTIVGRCDINTIPSLAVVAHTSFCFHACMPINANIKQWGKGVVEIYGVISSVGPTCRGHDPCREEKPTTLCLPSDEPDQ